MKLKLFFRLLCSHVLKFCNSYKVYDQYIYNFLITGQGNSSDVLRSQINELLSSFHFSLISSDWKFLSTYHQVGSKLFAELLVLKNKAKLLPKLFVLSSVEDGIRLRACYLRSSLIVQLRLRKL